MKVARRNWSLGAVLLLLLGAQALLRGGGAAEREVVPLLPGLEGAETTRIVIEDGAPGARRTLILERDAEGTWRLGDYAGYAAHGRQVDGFIDRLRGLTTLDLLSEDVASQADYGVDDSGTLVNLFGAGDTPLAALVQGESTAGRASYIRRAGDDAVYRAPHLPQITAVARQWIDRALVGVRHELVDTIHLSGTEMGTEVTLNRDAGQIQNWKAAGDRTVPAATMRSFFSRARALFIEDVEGAFDADRFGAARLVMTLVERGGRTFEVRFGADTDDGWTLTDPGGGEWLVTVPSAGAKLLLEAALALR